MLKHFLILLLCMGLIACDPTKLLEIKCSGKASVSVAVFANRSILSKYEDSVPGKICIQVPSQSTPPRLDTSILFGIGNWSEEGIGLVAKNTDSIIIHNSSGTVVLKSTGDIAAYLMRHRSGFANSLLTIQAE